MNKKTKNIIKAGTAAAAVISVGFIIGAAPAYAEENCNCAPETHLSDCNCGCNDMKAEVQKAQKDYDAAGEAAAKTKVKKNIAETELNNAEADYTAAQEHLKKKIDDNKEVAKADEADALKRLNEADAKLEQLKNEEVKASDAVNENKNLAETAAKIKSGEVTLEETPEYNAVIDDEKRLEELSIQKDDLGKKISGSEERAASYKEKADSLEKNVSDKEGEASGKQEIIEKSNEDRETVLKEYTELKNEIDLLKKEKEDLRNAVADSSQLKENSEAAYDAAAKAYDAATVESEAKEEEMDKAKKSLDEYIENAEKKRNSADLFSWMLTRDDLSPSIRKSAEVAVRALTNTPNDDENYGGEVSYGEIMKSTSIGDKDDATYLENVKRAVDYVEEGNGRRDMENAGLEHLLITPRLMAFAELNANYMLKNRVLMHTYAFPVSENAASGSGFFYMWYDEEKAIYEEQGEQAAWDDVGHYRTLVSPYINLTGFGYNFYFASHTFFVGAEEDGYTVEEFRSLIKDYEDFLDSEKQRLTNVHTSAQKDYKLAKERLDAALTEKQKTEEALSKAEISLSEILARQEKNADALSKGEQSLEKFRIVLDETGESLKKVIAEKESLEKEIDFLKAELREIFYFYDAEMEVLSADKEKYEKLSSEYYSTLNKLKKDREILSLIQDVDKAFKNYELKKEEHRLVKETLKSVEDNLDTARKEYDDKKNVSDRAQMLSYEEALTSEDEIYAQFSEAIEAVRICESKYIEAEKKYEKSVETLKKAQEELDTKKAELEKILYADKSLKKLCETHLKTTGGTSSSADISGNSRESYYKGGAVSVATVRPGGVTRTQAADTGENSTLPLWITVSALSMTGIGFTVFRKKGNNQ